MLCLRYSNMQVIQTEIVSAAYAIGGRSAAHV